MQSIYGIETLVQLAQMGGGDTVKLKIRTTPFGPTLEVVADPSKPKLCARGIEVFEKLTGITKAVSERHNNTVEDEMLAPLPAEKKTVTEEKF